jgi:hypothetical protein
MMHYLPGLSLIERLALWILVRSPRTSLVVVKEYLWPTVFTAANPADPVAAHVTGNQSEPASMLLERLYHQPSYGEEE